MASRELKNNIIRRNGISPVSQFDLDYAVQIGDIKRDQPLKAYPFFYSFVKFPYQEGIQVDSTGIYSITGNTAEGPDGIPITPGQILNIPIRMDEDANFHLLYIKYGAYATRVFTVVMDDLENSDEIRQNPANILANGDTIVFTSLVGVTGLNLGQIYYVVNATSSVFEVSATLGGAVIDYTGATGSYGVYKAASGTVGSREYLIYPYTQDNPSSAQGLVPDYRRDARIAHWTDLDVTAYMTSSGSRDLYGGFQREPITGVVDELPIPALNMQTTKDGLGMLKTPFQLAKDGSVLLKVRSRSAYTLNVYGHLFGYKITV